MRKVRWLIVWSCQRPKILDSMKQTKVLVLHRCSDFDRVRSLQADLASRSRAALPANKPATGLTLYDPFLTNAVLQKSPSSAIMSAWPILSIPWA
jgi:hypothetical protein